MKNSKRIQKQTTKNSSSFLIGQRVLWSIKQGCFFGVILNATACLALI